MEFAIILVCSLYYLICFYIGYKIFLEGENDFEPMETIFFIAINALICAVLSPVVIIIAGWATIHEK